jgi:hypothetical protein
LHTFAWAVSLSITVNTASTIPYKGFYDVIEFQCECFHLFLCKFSRTCINVYVYVRVCASLGFSRLKEMWTKYSELVLISIWTPNFWHLLLFRQMQMNWSLCSFFIKCLPLYLKYTSSIYFDWSFDGWNESFETFPLFAFILMHP